MPQMLSDKVKLGCRVAGTDLRQAFKSEVKRHLELEAGKICLTTVQGLYMLFIVTCHDSTNRAGTMYRLAALEMLSRLKPDKAFARWSPHIPDEADKRRAFSKTCWGIFNFEW